MSQSYQLETGVLDLYYLQDQLSAEQFGMGALYLTSSSLQYVS